MIIIFLIYSRIIFCICGWFKEIFYQVMGILEINCNKNITMKSRFIKLYSIIQDDRCCEVFYRCSSRTEFAPMWIMKPCLVQFIFTSHVHFRDTMHYHAKSIQLSNDHELANAICLKEIRIFDYDAKLRCCVEKILM